MKRPHLLLLGSQSPKHHTDGPAEVLKQQRTERHAHACEVKKHLCCSTNYAKGGNNRRMMEHELGEKLYGTLPTWELQELKRLSLIPGSTDS
mmetsp:Transcript_5800/g.9639  ORF Transcript_5800/g.9639 Transcript_5800/m.9639 type:complete len:92 (-) Transcript_5800:136-411(-)